MENGKHRFFLFFAENQLQVKITHFTFAATLAKSAWRAFQGCQICRLCYYIQVSIYMGNRKTAQTWFGSSVG